MVVKDILIMQEGGKLHEFVVVLTKLEIWKSHLIHISGNAQVETLNTSVL